jgi:hypothetical protein
LHYFCVHIHTYVGLFINYCINNVSTYWSRGKCSFPTRNFLVYANIQLKNAKEATRICIISTPASEKKHKWQRGI